MNAKGNNQETLTLPEIVTKKPWKKVAMARRVIARRSASSSATDQMANGNVLARKDGRIVTVEDFLADVELIKAGKKPKVIEIGLERTDLQKLENETREQKMLVQAQRQGKMRYVDLSQNHPGAVQIRKRQEQAAYKRLEDELNKAEIEEEKLQEAALLCIKNTDEDEQRAMNYLTTQ